MVYITIAAVVASNVGLLLFLFGFFLTRRELGLVSLNNALSLDSVLACNSNNSLNAFFDNDHQPENTDESRRSRIFLFIVDALRLDFMVNSDDNPASSSYNRFMHMHHLLRYNASQCALFGFRADPPTVTSQRLKGLMTGTLPTFVDIGSNFNSSSITEDNIIDQLIRRQNRVQSQSHRIVLGDDTWASVFPHQFDVSHVYDSFNTKDLHTVDNGIFQHLNDSLHSEWEILIAHFLGVDHIGHSHHAHHTLMGERLALMDQLLLEVIQQLPEDAVLLLFGDHGMTEEGEHGGASTEETDSGLFVYSKRKLFDVIPSTDATTDISTHVISSASGTVGRGEGLTDYESYVTSSWDDDSHSFTLRSVHDLRSHPRIVSQIDLTPTLSQWMHLPIPYSSLGMMIPELFLKETGNGSLASLSDLLFPNVMQVWRYLVVYFSDGTTAGTALSTLTELNKVLTSLPCDCSRYSEISTLSEDVHHRFEPLKALTVSASLGPLWLLLIDAVEQHVVVLFTARCVGTKTRDDLHSDDKTIAAGYVHFLTAAQQFGREQWTQFNMPYILSGLLVLSITVLTLVNDFTISQPTRLWCTVSNPLNSVMILLAVFHVLSVFSNSFIIEEHWIHLYAIQSFALYLAMQAFVSNTMTRRRRRAVIVSGVFVLLVLSRVVWTSKVLDTLQSTYDCEALSRSWFSTTRAAASVAWLSLQPLCQWILASGCVVANLILMHTAQPSLVSKSHVNYLHKLLWDGLTYVTLIVYWLVESHQSLSESLWGAVVVKEALLTLPRIVMILQLTALFNGNYSAVKSAISNNSKRSSDLYPSVFEVLRAFVWVFCLVLGQTSVVCVTVLLLHLMISVKLIESVLLTDGVMEDEDPVEGERVEESPVMEPLTARDLLEGLRELMNSAHLAKRDDKRHRSSSRSSLSVGQVVSIAIYFNMVGRFIFFASGHGMSFAKLKLSCGFIGVESFHFVYSGILLAINTFGCDVLAFFALFLVSHRWTTSLCVNVRGTPVRIDSLMLRTTLVYRVSLLLSSCAAAALHRRHLMVWAVFAPKVAFEAAFWLVGGILISILNTVTKVS